MAVDPRKRQKKLERRAAQRKAKQQHHAKARNAGPAQPWYRAEASAPLGVGTHAPPPPPPDPAYERWQTRWNEFEAQEGEGRIAVFLRTLDDEELMTDEMAFEMLNRLHEDAGQPGAQVRFTELVNALAQRRPEVYRQSSHYYLSWRLRGALTDDPQAVLPLAVELAALAGQDIDVVNRSLRQLAYHGHLAAATEAMRVAWPFVESSDNIIPLGISEFAVKGAHYEIYHYLEHTPSPDTHDPGLLERIRFFLPDPDLDKLREVIGDFAGLAAPDWTVDDFALKPARPKDRDDWDDEEEMGRKLPDPAADNLSRLIAQFVGYLRRVEGVPYPKGELVRNELFRYFIRRHQGDLDPRPSLLEQTMNPKKSLPPPPKPSHPLCPERVTFEVHLARLVGFMNSLYHTAAALFEIVPPWLRFLESRGLIDADQHARTVAELRPLHANLLGLMESCREDRELHRALLSWPTRADISTAPAETMR